jgi:large subunit ribosomal protein L22
MKALLKNYHQSPRKVRLVADLIRGKSIPEARAALLFMPQKSSPAIAKLLSSAVANARSTGKSESELFVKAIAVNKGAVMRRARPFARGRSGSIRKTMSIVTLELGIRVKTVKAVEPKAKKAKAAKPTK